MLRIDSGDCTKGFIVITLTATHLLRSHRFYVTVTPIFLGVTFSQYDNLEIDHNSDGNSYPYIKD